MSKDGLPIEVATDQEVENLLMGFIRSLVEEQENHRASQKDGTAANEVIS